jgi:ABC-type Zn2+ transport system substrate-binding protein/surface adhesin
VVRAKYYNKVPRATRWYTPSTTLLTTVRLQQVIVANLEIHTESTTSKLPNTCNKVAARSKGARMINMNDHKKIVGEIARRAILDCYEEEDDDNEEEEEDDDDEEEDDNDDDEEEDDNEYI